MNISAQSEGEVWLLITDIQNISTKYKPHILAWLRLSHIFLHSRNNNMVDKVGVTAQAPGWRGISFQIYFCINIFIYFDILVSTEFSKEKKEERTG